MRETRHGGGGGGGGKHAQTLVLHPVNLVKGGYKVLTSQCNIVADGTLQDDGRGMYNVVKIFVVAPAFVVAFFHLFPVLLSQRQVAKLSSCQGGLPATCDLEKLKEHFGQFGEIQDAVVRYPSLLKNDFGTNILNVVCLLASFHAKLNFLTKHVGSTFFDLFVFVWQVKSFDVYPDLSIIGERLLTEVMMDAQTQRWVSLWWRVCGSSKSARQ